MTDEHRGAIHECERSVRELDVFLKCAQRVLYRRDGQTARLQKGDHVGPAGSISVGAVHQHHIFGRWYWPGRGWGATRGSRTHHRGDAPQGNAGYESPSVHRAFIPQYGRESQAGEIPVAGGDGGLPFLNRSCCAENDEPPVELGVRCLWVVCFGYWRVRGMVAPRSWNARRWVSVASA